MCYVQCCGGSGCLVLVAFSTVIVLLLYQYQTEKKCCLDRITGLTKDEINQSAESLGQKFLSSHFLPKMYVDFGQY